MKERIINFLAEVMPQIDFTASEHLVDDGILDSLSIITLASELSMEFGVEFDLDTLEPDHLNSIDAIVKTVQNLQSRG